MSDPARARLFDNIGKTDDLGTLRGLREEIHDRMEALLSEQDIEQFYSDLNEVHDALIRRAVALSEAQLARTGLGSPPVPYAYLLFGSGGREEQTMTSDQDSGIIYADPVEPSRIEETERYFEKLSATIVQTLEGLGYPPCEGDVVSSNPLWCQSAAQWKAKLDLWFSDPDWERVRYLLIVADCRSVAGDEAAWRVLNDYFYAKVKEYPSITNNMLNNTMRHKVLVGVFGQLFKEHYGEDAGSLDLKYGAYIPMVNAIRLLAIQAEVRETSTMKRIAELTKLGVLTEEDGITYGDVIKLLLRLRLLTTSKRENGFYTNNGMLSSTRLTKELIEELKAGLRIVKKLQKQVRRRVTSKF